MRCPTMSAAPPLSAPWAVRVMCCLMLDTERPGQGNCPIEMFIYYYYYKYEPTITVIKAKTMHTLKHSLITPMHLFAFWALTKFSVKVF